MGPLLVAKPDDAPVRSVAVVLPAPALTMPHSRSWAGGVRLLGTSLAIVPGRTTSDPRVLREHAAAVLAVADLIERNA